MSPVRLRCRWDVVTGLVGGLAGVVAAGLPVGSGFPRYFGRVPRLAAIALGAAALASAMTTVAVAQADGCQDLDGASTLCAQYAIAGYCAADSTFRQYMEMTCPATCGLCSGDTTSPSTTPSGAFDPWDGMVGDDTPLTSALPATTSTLPETPGTGGSLYALVNGIDELEARGGCLYARYDPTPLHGLRIVVGTLLCSVCPFDLNFPTAAK